MNLATRVRRFFAGLLVATMGLGGVVAITPMQVVGAEVVKTNVKRNVMYYGDWSVWGGQGNFYPKDIPADQLTHLNFAFLDFDASGNLIFTDKDAATGNPLGQAGVTWGDVNAGILPALIELRAQNPNLKIGISIGGWSKSGDFSDMAANTSSRAKFVENVMKFVKYTDMDFVDIDWEYPAFVREADLVDNKNDEGTPNARPADKENYILLLQDLRRALDKQGVEVGKTYELSVALPVAKSKLEAGVDVARMFEIIDFGNLMTYDMRGAFDEISGHQTGLYPNSNDPMKENGFTIHESVQYMLGEGAPAEKLVVGAAYYTRGWEKVTGGTDPRNPGLFGEAAMVTKDADHSPSRGAANDVPLAVGDGGRRCGVWSYRNLDALKVAYPGLVEYWDDEAKAPYLYNATTGAFFTYDNVRSIREKTNYVKENNLGGMIAWMASQDAPTTSSKRDALTNATKQGLYGNATLPQHEIVYGERDITVTITPYQEAWGNNGGYTITIKNNEQLQESGEVLSLTEKIAETILLPKLYIKNNGPALSKGDYAAGTVTTEGEYTVVDFSSMYDGRAIEPGASHTFQLKAAGEVKDTSAIECIELVQRINKDGAEIRRQTVYGDTVVVNKAPVIHGVVDKTIYVGDDFDPLTGVTATDKEDGDLTAALQVTGSVDVHTEGEYTVAYSVSDSEGLTTTATRVVSVVEKEIVIPPVEPEVPDSDFGVGKGIVWDAQVNAPFIDMAAWVTKDGYNNSGAPNLVKLAEDTDIQYFNLGFIQTAGEVVDGKLEWGFGGLKALSEKDTHSQYAGIKKSIKELREVGGDVAISVGGLNGLSFWEKTQDVDVLTNTYMDIVTGFGLTRLDLDIEGSAQGKALNTANAAAIKRVQDATGVEIVLTLPVLPSGLTSLGEGTVEAFLAAGVDVSVVNLMTMCYGDATLLPGENYGTGSLRAVESTAVQLQNLYRRFANTTLSETEAYGKLGTTPSIGFEGSAHPVFTAAWAELVVDHAIEKGLAMTSFWSLGRDAQLESNTGVNFAYEFTNIFKRFPTNAAGGEIEKPNSKPVIHGATNVTITVGDDFDAYEGVTATDKEDGDLTQEVVVTGTVDTTTAGVYTLTYTVTDSKGESVTVTRKVTVKAAPIIDENNTYVPGKAYVAGEKVTYNGVEYTAKWWTQSVPGTDDSWGKTIIANPDGSYDYEVGQVYTEGMIVTYNGATYRANWWTQSTPGSDASWTLIAGESGDNNGGGEGGTDGVATYVPGKAYIGGDQVRYNGEIYVAKWWTTSTPGSDDSWNKL